MRGIRNISRYLGVSRDLCDRLLRQGIIKALRLGAGRIWWTHPDWIKEGFREEIDRQAEEPGDRGKSSRHH